MSGRQSRFEIVRTAAGWTVRFRASNGPIVMSSGRQVYTRRRGARNAVLIMARAFWDDGSCDAYFSPDLSHRFVTNGDGDYVEVREVDER